MPCAFHRPLVISQKALPNIDLDGASEEPFGTRTFPELAKATLPEEASEERPRVNEGS